MDYYQDIASRITIIGCSGSAPFLDNDQVENEFKGIYNTSSVVRASVNDWLSRHGQNFEVKYEAGRADSAADSGVISIDPYLAESLFYLSKYSKIHSHTFKSVLVHEVWHATSPNRDDALSFPDLMGDNIREFVNPGVRGDWYK